MFPKAHQLQSSLFKLAGALSSALQTGVRTCELIIPSLLTIAQETPVRLVPAIPIIRIFWEKKTMEFYLDFLIFTL